MNRTQEKAEFVAVLTRELPDHSIGAIVELALKVMRQGASYGRLAVQLCNGDVDQDEFERRTDGIKVRLMKLLGVLGIGVVFGGDPRGFTVKLVLKSNRSNSWGADGWGVPGS